jgi:hypothetical protein
MRPPDMQQYADAYVDMQQYEDALLRMRTTYASSYCCSMRPPDMQQYEDAYVVVLLAPSLV